MLGEPYWSQIGAALALGALIGLERGWSQRDATPGSRVAGLRTHIILALLGALAGLVATQLHWAYGVVILSACGVALVVGYRADAEQHGTLSVTSALVALLALLLGLLTTLDYVTLALVVAAIIVLLLSMRAQLHGWLQHITPEEMRAVARLGIISLAILPLLPDAGYGPYNALNPYKIWMVVVLVSALSFAGYIATRLLGPGKGLLATAATGAIVSSTVVTVAFANKLKAGHSAQGVLVAGIALASIVMYVRVLLLTAALVPYAFLHLAILILPAALVALAMGGWALRRAQDGHEGDLKLGNPFDIGPALLLAGLVAVLSVAVRWANAQFGDAGLVVLLSFTGLADVDAAIIALSQLPQGTVAAHIAAIALASPILLNTAFKGVLALGILRNRQGWRAALPLFLSAAAGVAGIPFLF